MKLEHFINSCIYNYPTLYRCDTHAQSRILVLDHIFLCIGTGLEWHPKGYLADIIEYDKNDKPKYNTNLAVKELPKNYYEMDLWYIDIKKENFKKIKKALGKSFYYVRPPFNGDIEVVYEADEVFARELMEKYAFIEEHQKGIYDYLSKEEALERIYRPHAAISFYHSKSNYAFSKVHAPYPMCNYSPLVEMINGKTNSPHIDNFDLVNIRPDWIKGAVEIAKDTLEFYKDPKKNRYSHSHPSKSLRDFKQSYDADPVKFVKERKSEGMTKDIKIEEWCEICWQRFLDEQIGYCTKLIEMYGLKEGKGE